ncbi:MAG TPA: 3-hydroxyacyl-CoA dehydrogenase NAD-binding domain-containing protein [Edaphobacter sp.]|nr:3-hydroxyacyl-CoA dehydrogenase NAD-binding domain-containing protein [Edaphobacter sp.]
MNEAAAIQPSFEIRRVAIIGAGVAGRSFALACAGAGFHVVLEDVMPAKLRKAETDFAECAALSQRGTAGRLELALTVEDAVREADVAVDFVPDELESKLEIFSMIDRMAPPKTILCTPSDALSITDLASCVYRPERCVAVRGNLLRGEGADVPVIRLLYPASVAESTLAAVDKFLQTLGVEVRRESDPEVPLLMKNVLG